MERSRCKCGRVKSKFAGMCHKCHNEFMDASCAASQKIVDKGECPQCGGPLRSNAAILGWWQCAQYGEPGFRLYPDKPSCNWQGFTQRLYEKKS